MPSAWIVICLFMFVKILIILTCDLWWSDQPLWVNNVSTHSSVRGGTSALCGVWRKRLSCIQCTTSWQSSLIFIIPHAILSYAFIYAQLPMQLSSRGYAQLYTLIWLVDWLSINGVISTVDLTHVTGQRTG